MDRGCVIMASDYLDDTTSHSQYLQSDLWTVRLISMTYLKRPTARKDPCDSRSDRISARPSEGVESQAKCLVANPIPEICQAVNPI